MTQLRPALVMFILYTVVTGVAYPALITGIAQLVMPWQANGSLVTARDGHVTGSSLIGQSFDAPEYFWGRPSATAAHPDDAASSGASNLGPTNPALVAAVRGRIERLRAADPEQHALVPIDLVTASASGLDPDITPAAALHQVGRIARARQLSERDVRSLVEAHIETRVLGLIGEPHVNVLRLNLALETLARPSS